MCGATSPTVQDSRTNKIMIEYIQDSEVIQEKHKIKIYIYSNHLNI